MGSHDYDYDASLNYATLFNYKDTPPQDLNSINLFPHNNNEMNGINTTNSNKMGMNLQESELLDDSDSDDVLKYISQMLMEEDMEEKPCMFHDALALQAAEKPFYDVLGKKYLPLPYLDHCVGSPDSHSCVTCSGGSSGGAGGGGDCSSSSNSRVDHVSVLGVSQTGLSPLGGFSGGFGDGGGGSGGGGGGSSSSSSSCVDHESVLVGSDSRVSGVSQRGLSPLSGFSGGGCVGGGGFGGGGGGGDCGGCGVGCGGGGVGGDGTSSSNSSIDHESVFVGSDSRVSGVPQKGLRGGFGGGGGGFGGGGGCGGGGSSSSKSSIDHESVLVGSDSRVLGVSQRGLSPLGGFSGGFGGGGGGVGGRGGGFDNGVSSKGLPSMGVDIFSDKESIIQFQKGVEEASKFLPKNNTLIIDLDDITCPVGNDKTGEVEVKKEKIHYREDNDDFNENRSNKQSALSLQEEEELSEMFDNVLLCPNKNQDGGCNPEKTVPSRNNRPDNKGRGRRTDNNTVVDLRTILILCAQSTASDDRMTVYELLKKIREHSSRLGDGSQRLAHYFANALEARLAGTGSQIYTALKPKWSTAANMLKAYQFFLRVCPLKKICISFANQTIMKAAERGSRLHIIDFGILYGFQWPALIQHLSEMPGGPPTLCITGIDLPQPGFKPGERVEATGSRLSKYCDRFKVPFEYHAIAKKWETIKVEDLHTRNDEIVVVNCLFRFKNLLEETIMVDSPRSAVLDLIRIINPNIFVHGVVNGSYNAPFFVTRFREALFHYSTMFDMFDTNAARDDPERLMFEKEFYGREIMNVVACEGSERIERPETYKQWQSRIIRAGFRQVPLDEEILKRLRCKMGNFHKDFSINVDGEWTLVGWKGRITGAVAAWTPAA